MFLKIVQTEVSDELHKKILEISKREKKPIKRIVREALEEWIAWRGEIANDSFLSSSPMDFEVETDSANLDEILYKRAES